MKFWAVVTMALCALSACGGATDEGDDPTPSGGKPSTSTLGKSGVALKSQITSLAAKDLGKVCDYMARQLGGYGTTPSCPDPSMTVPADVSQSACINKVKGKKCDLSVEQVEACADALNKKRCSLPFVCEPLWQCANK